MPKALKFRETIHRHRYRGYAILQIRKPRKNGSDGKGQRRKYKGPAPPEQIKNV